MSRVLYNEDNIWAGIRWAGAAKKAIYGKKGQALLRELEAALLALPEPKLIDDEFATSEGDVCALGALAKARGFDANDMVYWEVEPETAQAKLGMTFTLAWEIISQNDDGPFPGYGAYRWTPEQRYQHVLRWVRQHLVTVEAES